MILRHYLGLDRFVALRFALAAIHERQGKWAVGFFDDVMTSWNQSFTSSRPQDISAIEKYLPEAITILDRPRAELLRFSLRPYRHDDVEEAATRVRTRYREALDRLGD